MMSNVDLLHKLKYFPQDAEIISSDYGLQIILFSYVEYQNINGYQLLISPSYDLETITQEELDNLPWIKNPKWLDEQHQKNFESEFK